MSVATKDTTKPADAESPSVELGQNGANAVPAAKRGQIYTMTALEGLDAAELVKAAFAKRTIGAATPRHVEVLAPDGPSTSGGKRARQAIRLVPVGTDGAPVMCGFLDVAKKRVELRSYGMVAQQYHERFDEQFDVTAVEYEALCKDLEATLMPFRYEFGREAEPSLSMESKRARLSSRSAADGARKLNMVIAVLVALVLAALFLAMLRR